MSFMMSFFFPVNNVYGSGYITVCSIVKCHFGLNVICSVVWKTHTLYPASLSDLWFLLFSVFALFKNVPQQQHFLQDRKAKST